ncbi:hypothetical protein [Parahaliea mediterranea]|uniref:Sulfotransferase domain-containing protein n=1 Tax=Parahaliea mediterranea TaxID=651086 RepID=A0A939DFP8_9GAMM|nr:hypothetical protein [Parahaliea mediterranea]MBN7797435.1 hypothetical protein [Parahaliea mediterranea]
MPQLFIHIGLHKTGTTFLQREVFPLWKGVNYLAQDKLEYLTRMREGERYLLSREGLSGVNWARSADRIRSIENLGRLFPQARVIISFRQHAGYIASSYNQYLQRGGSLSFPEYFEPVGGGGLLKIEDFMYRPKLEAVRRAFVHEPLVLLHSDIVSDLPLVLSLLESYVGGRAPSVDAIRNRRHNQSVSYYPAKALRYLNARSQSALNAEGRWPLYHWRLQRLGLDPRSICQALSRRLFTRPLLVASDLDGVDDLFAEDWAYIRDQAETWRSAVS